MPKSVFAPILILLVLVPVVVWLTSKWAKPSNSPNNFQQNGMELTGQLQSPEDPFNDYNNGQFTPNFTFSPTVNSRITDNYTDKHRSNKHTNGAEFTTTDASFISHYSLTRALKRSKRKNDEAKMVQKHGATGTKGQHRLHPIHLLHRSNSFGNVHPKQTKKKQTGRLAKSDETHDRLTHTSE